MMDRLLAIEVGTGHELGGCGSGRHRLGRLVAAVLFADDGDRRSWDCDVVSSAAVAAHSYRPLVF